MANEYTFEQHVNYAGTMIDACGTAIGLSRSAAILLYMIDGSADDIDEIAKVYEMLRDLVIVYSGMGNHVPVEAVDQAIREDYEALGIPD